MSLDVANARVRSQGIFALRCTTTSHHPPTVSTASARGVTSTRTGGMPDGTGGGSDRLGMTSGRRGSTDGAAEEALFVGGAMAGANMSRCGAGGGGVDRRMSSNAIGVGMVNAGSGTAGAGGAPSGRVFDPTLEGGRGSELALGIRAVVVPTWGNPIFWVVRGTSGDDAVDCRAPRSSS